MTAQEAIEQSVVQDEIVTIAWNAELEDTLLAACDDSVDTATELGEMTEFWGVDDDGAEWRVHLQH